MHQATTSASASPSASPSPNPTGTAFFTQPDAELPQDSPSMMYPSQLAPDEPVTPPYSHDNNNGNSSNNNKRPMTQPTDLMLRVLEAPHLQPANNNNTTTNNTQTPAPRPLHEQRGGSLTEDLMQEEQEQDLEQDFMEEEEEEAAQVSEEGTENTPTGTITYNESQRCLVDFVEWWCHKIMTSSKTEDLKTAEEEFQKAMKNLVGPSTPTTLSTSSSSSAVNTPAFGRLHNRIQLTALSLDLGMLQCENKKTAKKLLGSDNDHDNDDELYYSSDLTASSWALQYRETLILLKSMLLRKDANLDTTTSSNSNDTDVVQQNAAPDPETEQHPLFQTEYRRVVRLLKVQEYLAAFRERLIEATTSTSTSDNNKKMVDCQQVQKAIDRYDHKIHALFGNNHHTAKTTNETTEAETTTDQPEEDDSSLNSLMSSTYYGNGNTNHNTVPQELVGFLLKDLYSKTDTVTSAEELPQRLIGQIESIMFGRGKFSHNATRNAVRTLLQQWADLVLETPTLVQLGYGMDDPNQTKSPSRQQAEAEEDDLLRRLSSDGHYGGVEGLDGFRQEDYGVSSDFGHSSDEEEKDGNNHNHNKRKAANSNDMIQQLQQKKKTKTNNLYDTDSENDSISSHSNSNDESNNSSDVVVVEPPFFPGQRRGSMQEMKSLYNISRRKTKPVGVDVKKEKLTDNEKETDQAQQQQQRRPFTDEETQAIMDGVRKYGKGKWKIIKENSGGKLDQRDVVQIKDKYRNLVIRGILQE